MFCYESKSRNSKKLIIKMRSMWIKKFGFCWYIPSDTNSFEICSEHHRGQSYVGVEELCLQIRLKLPAQLEQISSFQYIVGR